MIKDSNGNVVALADNEVFVFGSNMNGFHLGGAAKQALEWGAIYGIGVGRQGQTYAIPTLDTDMSQLELRTIKKHLEDLVKHAELYPSTIFLLTKIGQGIAGYRKESIESIMPVLPSNIIKV